VGIVGHRPRPVRATWGTPGHVVRDLPGCRRSWPAPTLGRCSSRRFRVAHPFGGPTGRIHDRRLEASGTRTTRGLISRWRTGSGLATMTPPGNGEAPHNSAAYLGLALSHHRDEMGGRGRYHGTSAAGPSRASRLALPEGEAASFQLAWQFLEGAGHFAGLARSVISCRSRFQPDCWSNGGSIGGPCSATTWRNSVRGNHEFAERNGGLGPSSWTKHGADATPTAALLQEDVRRRACGRT